MLLADRLTVPDAAAALLFDMDGVLLGARPVAVTPTTAFTRPTSGENHLCVGDAR